MKPAQMVHNGRKLVLSLAIGGAIHACAPTKALVSDGPALPQELDTAAYCETLPTVVVQNIQSLMHAEDSGPFTRLTLLAVLRNQYRCAGVEAYWYALSLAAPLDGLDYPVSIGGQAINSKAELVIFARNKFPASARIATVYAKMFPSAESANTAYLLDPGYQPALINRIQTYLDLGHIDEARKLLSSVHEPYASSEAAETLAELLIMDRNGDAALDLLAYSEVTKTISNSWMSKQELKSHSYRMAALENLARNPPTDNRAFRDILQEKTNSLTLANIPLVNEYISEDLPIPYVVSREADELPHKQENISILPMRAALPLLSFTALQALVALDSSYRLRFSPGVAPIQRNRLNKPGLEQCAAVPLVTGKIEITGRPVLKAIPAVGGTPIECPDGDHMYRATQEGIYRLGAQIQHRTPNWYSSIIPYNAKLRWKSESVDYPDARSPGNRIARTNREIEYYDDHRKSWISVTGFGRHSDLTQTSYWNDHCRNNRYFHEPHAGDPGQMTSSIVCKTIKRGLRLYKLSPEMLVSINEQSREAIFSASIKFLTLDEQIGHISAKTLPNTYTSNDFGPWAWRLIPLDKRLPSVQFLHTTPIQEHYPSHPLGYSHGCIHINPSDRDELIKQRVLQKGTILEVAPFDGLPNA